MKKKNFKKIIDLSLGELIMIIENELVNVFNDGVSIVNISTPNELEWENGDVDDDMTVEFTLDSDENKEVQTYSMLWTRKEHCFSHVYDLNQQVA